MRTSLIELQSKCAQQHQVRVLVTNTFVWVSNKLMGMPQCLLQRCAWLKVLNDMLYYTAQCRLQHGDSFSWQLSSSSGAAVLVGVSHAGCAHCNTVASLTMCMPGAQLRTAVLYVHVCSLYKPFCTLSFIPSSQFVSPLKPAQSSLCCWCRRQQSCCLYFLCCVLVFAELTSCQCCAGSDARTVKAHGRGIPDCQHHSRAGRLLSSVCKT